MLRKGDPISIAQDSSNDVKETMINYYDDDWTLMGDSPTILSNSAENMVALANQLKLRQELLEHDHIDWVTPDLDVQDPRAKMYRYQDITSDVKRVVKEHGCKIGWQSGQEFRVECPTSVELSEIDESRERNY